MEPGPSTTPGNPTHLVELDFMRSAAIVSVVYLHAFFPPWEGVHAQEWMAARLLYLAANSAVPAFIWVSGFLVGRDTSPATAFVPSLTHRLRTLYVPLALWSAASFAYRLALDGGIDRNLVRDALLFNTSGQYYFLVVLLPLYALGYLLRRWPGAWVRVSVPAAFAVSTMTIAYYEATGVHDVSSILAFRNPACWLFFFVLGFAAGREVLPRLTRGRAAVAGLVALVGAAAYLGPGLTSDYFPNSYFGLSTFAFSSVALVLYPAAARRVVDTRLRVIAALDPYTFGIFLVHMPFFIGFVTEETAVHELLPESYLARICVTALIGLCGSAAFVAGTAHVVPPVGKLLFRVTRSTQSQRPRLSRVQRRELPRSA